MIIFTTLTRGDTTLICLYGDLAPEDSVPMLTDHLDGLAGTTDLIVDLSGLGAVGSAPVSELTRHLATAPAHAGSVVIRPGSPVDRSSRAADPHHALYAGAPARRTPIEEP